MRKTLFYSISIISVTLFSCNRDLLEQQKNQIASLRKDDSLRLLQIQSKDSSLGSYLHSINSIESNLDSLKQRSHILSISGEKKRDTSTIMSDLRAISNLIVQNREEIAALEKRVHANDGKNAELLTMIARLNKTVSERDSEIVVLQHNLATANKSMMAVIQQLQDTSNVVTTERSTISTMTTQMHTVYYTVGKAKDLENKHVINKQGGVIGIGKTYALNPSINSGNFTQADLTTLSSIELNAKLDRIVTSHPSTSYRVVAGAKTDVINITDGAAFWSQSKYFVAIIK